MAIFQYQILNTLLTSLLNQYIHKKKRIRLVHESVHKKKTRFKSNVRIIKAH